LSSDGSAPVSSPQPLFGSRDLADWVRAGGIPQRRITAYALRLAWHAYWFEFNWRTESRQLDERHLPADPLFIIGPWRSGTTVLHELLASATGWLTPRTWQCFNPSTCFLARSPVEVRSIERPMDQGRIASHGPQEDEFALLLLGEPSPYRAFIDPRRLPECSALLRSASDPPLTRWQCFLRGIASPGSRLLLKSPNHTFRLPRLRALFPQAQFLWVGRDIGEVLASNLRMWQAMFARYALWSCPSGALETFLSQALEASTLALERCLGEMPPGRMLWVDFERLRADPTQVMRRVLEFLNAGSQDHACERALSRALQDIPVHPGSRERVSLDASIEQRLQQLMSVARLRFGGEMGQAPSR